MSNKSFAIAAGSMFLISCAGGPPQPESEPPREVQIVHDQGEAEGSAFYRLEGKNGELLASFPSIIDRQTVENVPGLAVDQEVVWSSTRRTAVVYENISDASPDYRQVLIRWNGEESGYEVFKMDLGTRTPGLVGYPLWPGVVSVSDSELILNWSTDPKQSSVTIKDLELTLVSFR